MRHAKVFRDTARFDPRRAPGRALHVIAAGARAASEAGRVMVRENAFARRERPAVFVARNLTRPDGGNYAGGLVPEHQGRLTLDIPRHHVTRADSAGGRAHEHFAFTQLRDGALFDANVARIVKNRRSHRRRDAHGSNSTFMPTPASRSSNADAMSSSRQIRVIKRISGNACDEIRSYARRTSRGVK